MKRLVSVVLILLISLTGVVFAIEGAPDEVGTSIVSPTESAITENNEIKEESSTDSNKSVDLPSETIDDAVSNNNDGGVSVDKINVNPLTDKANESLLTTGQEKSSVLPEINVSFTSPVFKIIVLVVAVIIILLLLVSLSKKKDTMYSGHHDIPPKKRLPRKSSEEVLPELESSDLNLSTIEEKEIIIPPIEIKGTDKDLDFNLADDFPNDIDLVLDNNLDFSKTGKIDNIDDLDDIDDIDQLSKAIEEKEAQLKKLEEEILEEKVIKENVDIDNVEEDLDLDKVKDKDIEGVKKEKNKEKKVDEKEKITKKNKTKVTSETKIKKTEVEKVETKTLPKKGEPTSDLVEDFLKNMEKSMKEDNKK